MKEPAQLGQLLFRLLILTVLPERYGAALPLHQAPGGACSLTRSPGTWGL